MPLKTCSVVGAEQPELDDADVFSGEAASAVRESCLVPYLELELAQASFTDMGNRCATRSSSLLLSLLDDGQERLEHPCRHAQWHMFQACQATSELLQGMSPAAMTRGLRC